MYTSPWFIVALRVLYRFRILSHCPKPRPIDSIFPSALTLSKLSLLV